MPAALTTSVMSPPSVTAALAIILAVVGVKMLTAGWLKSVFGPNFNFYLLGLIFLILTAGVIASLMHPRKHDEKHEGDGHGVHGQPTPTPVELAKSA